MMKDLISLTMFIVMNVRKGRVCGGICIKEKLLLYTWLGLNQQAVHVIPRPVVVSNSEWRVNEHHAPHKYSQIVHMSLHNMTWMDLSKKKVAVETGHTYYRAVFKLLPVLALFFFSENWIVLLFKKTNECSYTTSSQRHDGAWTLCF